MLICCPFCGVRENNEFSVLGDAQLTERPDPSGANAAHAFHEYVHLRANPAGAHRELWYHEAGCRAWLVVTRDTLTHEVHSVHLANEHHGRGDSQ
ncbi:MAG: sarcosine oxidase subunit delta [Gammaproteobacteria bacterium]|nr:sarcosine oxidase subunit delta [Gammaproteobacteria bacterium]